MIDPHIVCLWDAADDTPMAGISRPLAFATGVLCIVTLLACGGRWSWACDLLVNFRTQLAWLLGVTLLLALAVRRWPIAGAAAAGFALNLWPMYGAFFGPAATPPANARAVRVVEFNVNIANDDLRGIAAYLESLRVDVVVLTELPAAKAERLAALLPRLPNRYVTQPKAVWGVVILSRWPLSAAQLATRDGLPFAARVDVDLGDRKFRLYGAHFHWPLVPASARIRNAQLAALGRELEACPHACVAVGDFNVTPWSSHYRDLRSPGIHDCAGGRGLLGTWPSILPAALRIRIDQCLTAGAAGIVDIQVGRSIGSDHLATINDLSIGGG
jgi:endonuclease/exonuclease/phosphatase (EEP) superfamily protein YafD